MPLLTKLSTTRRLTARRSTRSQKSKSDWKRPPSRRARQDRLHRALAHVLDRGQAEADGRGGSSAPGTTVKNMSDSFTSGGSTRMPISRHSPMYWTILSVFARSEVSSAAMKYDG